MIGFGLGPTVPVCMAWTNEIFQKRHREVGVAAASALVSGLGNLGSITTTYALYTGWPEDAAKGPHQYRKSNYTMIGILAMSIASSIVLTVLLSIFGMEPSQRVVASSGSSAEEIQDGAALRERQMRGFSGMLGRKKN